MPTLRQDLARWRYGALLVVFAGVLGGPAPALAAPPADDDWAIEHTTRDPVLLDQRFAKLRQSPFDGGQWRALEAAAGKAALIKRIDAAAARSPEDVALGILRARARIAEGNPREAASILAGLRDRSGRWRRKVVELEVDTRIAAGDVAAALPLLEAAGDRKSIARAYDLAERGGLEAQALRLARALADGGGGADDQLRVARAALRAGESATSDAAFAAALKAGGAAHRSEIQREWARARLQRGDVRGAADLVWTALGEGPSASEREALWTTLGECYGRDGRGELSSDRLEAWLRDPKHQRDAAAWRTLARVQSLQGVDAIPSWRKAVEIDPDDRESISALVLALEATGDADATVAEFRRLGGSRTPERAQLGLEVAGRVIANGHRGLGLTLAAEIAEGAGRSATTLLALLDFYNVHDDTTLALATAERLVKTFPRDPEARIALGEQLFQMRRDADALAEWSMLPKLIRPAHRGWARYAEILAEHHHPDALVALQRALAAAPNEPAYIRLRALLEQEGRVPQRALTSWQELLDVAKGPQHRLLRDEARTRVVDLLVSGSSGKGSLRRREAERAALATMKGADPPERKREAALFLAELYGREGRYDEAVEIHEALVAMAPDDPERLAALALAQRRAGRSDAAMATLEKLLVIDPRRSSDVLAELAETAFDAGDLARALDAAERAAAAGADSSGALVRLGELYERRGDAADAEKTYAKALEIAPRDPLARLRLAELSLARGHNDKAAALFREIVESGGPPDLVQQAGRRALDLAEASANTIAVVELAMIRSQHEPAAEEPRELLLDALDRSRQRDVQTWLAADATGQRTGALRRVLVYSLTRDPIGMRLRAAEHLGALALPGSAVPLARMGAQLTPPRDAPRAVREAYAQARAAALYAAGALVEPEAAPIFAQVLANRSNSGDIRYAAAWALLQRGLDGVDLDEYLRVGSGGDPVLAALACLAIAESPGPGKASLRASIAPHTADARPLAERYACAAASAALTPDGELKPLQRLLEHPDPIFAAIASWRLGRSTKASDEVVEALVRRYLGPKGVARDAAAAALARLLGAAPAATKTDLPQLRGRWETTVSRWLIQRTTGPQVALRADALRGHQGAVRRAVEAAQGGTRAEQEAAREALKGCERATTPALCLAPLVAGTTPRGR